MADLINGRTPGEIKCGVRCNTPCKKCPYAEYMKTDTGCAPYVNRDALALIEYLEAKIRSGSEENKDADSCN